VHKKKVENVLMIVPSYADEINGVAIGWSLLGVEEKDTTDINGLYINASPLPVIGIAVGVLYFVTTLLPPYKKKNLTSDSTNTTELKTNTAITSSTLNGVAVSIFENAGQYTMNGLQISAFAHLMGSSNGLSVAGIINSAYTIKGVQISLFNKAMKGKGVQLGLINNSKEFKGVQIGVWNKIGKRGLPFINFSFKKRKNTTAIVN
jgi:hypothetical protein